jgi:nucleolar GTP-binding protein
VVGLACRFESLTPEERKIIDNMVSEAHKISGGAAAAAAQGGEADQEDDGILMTMSTLSEEGVMSVKQAACERLLNHRVEIKVAGE